MTRVRQAIVAVLAVSLIGGIAGCTKTKHKVVPGPVITTTVTRSATPGPTKTVVRDFRTYQAGQTGLLASRAQHASMIISVSKPTTSTTRLSPSYGDAPRFGHYVTFVLTIKNNGRVPILLRRLDFFVRTPGAGKTTTDDGNAPFSGSGTQLDTTELVPGKSVTNNLTFDVAHPSGTLFYAPNGDKSIAWVF